MTRFNHECSASNQEARGAYRTRLVYQVVDQCLVWAAFSSFATTVVNLAPLEHSRNAGGRRGRRRAFTGLGGNVRKEDRFSGLIPTDRDSGCDLSLEEFCLPRVRCVQHRSCGSRGGARTAAAAL